MTGGPGLLPVRATLGLGIFGGLLLLRLGGRSPGLALALPQVFLVLTFFPLALEHPVTVDIQVTGPESRRISIEGVSL